MPWNLINHIHGTLAQCSLPLPMSLPHSDLHFYHPLTCISLNHVSPFITNYLIGSIHFSPILKENLCHIFVPFLCWCVQRSGAILRSPTWSANADTQKRMVSKQILDNICLLPFYFTFTKTQTQHWLCQSIAHLSVLLRKTCSFYWHNTLMHKCPKKCQSHGMFEKCNALNNILCFQGEFKASPYSNSEIQLPIQPLWTQQETCTQVAHPWCRPCPWENASITNMFFGELT